MRSWRADSLCLRVARSRNYPMLQKSASSSFDHLVGAQQDRGGERDADRFGGLQVEDKLELRRLLDRQLGCFCPAREPVHVVGGASAHSCKLGPPHRRRLKCESSSPARTALSGARLHQASSPMAIRFVVSFVTRSKPTRLHPRASNRSSARSLMRPSCKPRLGPPLPFSIRPAPT